MAFEIFGDSSCDLSTELRRKHNIHYFRMGITLEGKDYHADLDYQEYTQFQLYDWAMKYVGHIKTSLITVQEFCERMEPFLKEGKDILYLPCTDRLSGSANVFKFAVEELQPKYPDRKMLSVQCYRADMALGMMILEAARLRDEGKSMEEIIKWIEENRQFYHQIGSLETLTNLRAMGRVSGTAAFFANALGIKPVIMSDIWGNNYAFKKVKGSKKAREECFEYIKENMIEGVTDVIYVGQADCQETQDYFINRIENELHIRAERFWIGPIVGISCGRGMYGIYFRGKEVTADSEAKK